MSDMDSTTCDKEAKVVTELNAAENAGKYDAHEIDKQTSDDIKPIEMLLNQLTLAKEEIESKNQALGAQALSFEKEKQTWLTREKELLCKNVGLDISSEVANGNEANQDQKEKLLQLETHLHERTEELKNVKEQLKKAQDRLTQLESSSKDSGSRNAGRKGNKGHNEKNQHQQSDATDESLRRENEKLRAALNTAVERLKAKTLQASSMERQNVQLRAQVASLKEVTSITKDLLGIRNAEVEQLRSEMDAVEARIALEKEQRSAAIARVETATRLNADLKCQYEIQMSTFKQLKSKYEEKVELLSKENRRLVAEANAEGRPGIPLEVGPLETEEEEYPQH